MSCWSEAPPNLKKNFKDWLGDLAYAEFLRHVYHDCPLDVIYDWWHWSKQTTIKDVNYIYQELFRMVRESDPVTWCDDPLPPSSERLRSVSRRDAPFRRSTVGTEGALQCLVEISTPDHSQPHESIIIGQNESCDSSQHGITTGPPARRLFLSSCESNGSADGPFTRDSTDDARDFHFQSMQSCDSIDFSDDNVLSPTGPLPSQDSVKARFRPSPEFRSSFVRPLHRK